MTDQLARLHERAGQLALALDRAAGDLADTGRPVAEDLVDHLSGFSAELRAIAYAVQVGYEEESKRDRLSLNGLQGDWLQLQRRQQAAALLGRVDRLRHEELSDFAPLAGCRQAAERLLIKLNDSAGGDWLDVEIADVLAGTHPLASVLQLVDEHQTLSDGDWNVHEDRIVAAFGRGIATALARGKIAEVTTAPAVATAAADFTPVDSTRSAKETTPSYATSADRKTLDTFDESSLIFDTPAPPPKLSPDLFASDSARPTPSPSLGTDTDRRAVAPSRAASGDVPPVMLAVLKLIREERYALAGHLLDTCSHSPPGETCPVPASLMRALALSQQVCYPRGELAAQIENELRGAASWLRSSNDPDDRLAAGLLVRTACLPVALLGASPLAVGLLRGFDIEPGTSQLYNFCARVAAFGDRLQGFAAELFQTSSEGTAWNEDAEQLQQDVRDWSGAVVARAVTYTRCSPLFVHAHWTLTTRTVQREPQRVDEWARWQETLMAAHRLLQPVLAADWRERNLVKQEVSRLMGLLEAPRESAARSGADLRAALAHHDSMRETLQEALEFAHRWLRLQAASPQQRRSLPSQAVEELRADLLDRADQVSLELQELVQRRSQRWVSAGAEACRNAVQYIQRLCSGRLTLPLREPNVQHVLSGVLLKVSGLELDTQWDAGADRNEVQQLLLDYIQQPDCSWRDAFELQCAQADHLATLRLLEMPVWRDDDERGVLRQLRSQRLEACRRSSHKELSELMTQVHVAREGMPEQEHETAEWLRRAEGVLSAIPRQQSFATVHRQIDALRTSWIRLQSGERRNGEHANDSTTRRLPRISSPDFTRDAAPGTDDATSATWVF